MVPANIIFNIMDENCLLVLVLHWKHRKMAWRNKSETTGKFFPNLMKDGYKQDWKKGELKEQTWSEVADSAKGTLVTEVEADETVEVVAPCIMGTFIQASQTKDKGRGCGRGGGGGGGDRNDMVTMAKCAGSQVMAQIQWNCQDEVYRHMQKQKRLRKLHILLKEKRKHTVSSTND